MLAMLTVMTSLAACEKATSNIYVSSCLPVVKYTQEQQAQVADEMEQSPNAMWVVFVKHYGKLRREVRAACGE